MDTLPIKLEDKCKVGLSKITKDSKYLDFHECKKIVSIDKKNFESIANDIIGAKCADYINKSLSQNKEITKKDLFENCEKFKKIEEKKKKGKRGGGKGQKVPPLPIPKKDAEKKIDKDLWKELFKDLGKALKGDDIVKEILNALKKFVLDFCTSLAQESGSDLKKIGSDAISGINKLMRYFRNGISGVSGWDEEGFTLSPEIYNVAANIGKCLIAAVGLHIVWKIANYFRKSDNPTQRGNRPDSNDFDGDDDDDDDGNGDGRQRVARQPAAQQPVAGRGVPVRGTGAVPLTSAVSAPMGAGGQVDMIRSFMIGQAKQQSKEKATATYNKLAQDIRDSVIHDQTTMDKTGYIKTPSGIMKATDWDKKKEQLALDQKRTQYNEYERQSKQQARKYMADTEEIVKHNQNEATKSRDNPNYVQNIKPEPRRSTYNIPVPKGYTKDFDTILSQEMKEWNAKKTAQNIMKETGIWNKTPIWDLKNTKTGEKPTEAMRPFYQHYNTMKEMDVRTKNDLEPLKPYQPDLSKNEFQQIYAVNDNLQSKGNLDDVYNRYVKAKNKIQINNDRYLDIMTENNVYVKKPQVVNKPSQFLQKGLGTDTVILRDALGIPKDGKPIIPTPEGRLDVSVPPPTPNEIHDTMFTGSTYNPNPDARATKQRIDRQKLQHGIRPEERSPDMNSIVGQVAGTSMMAGGMALTGYATIKHFQDKWRAKIEADITPTRAERVESMRERAKSMRERAEPAGLFPPTPKDPVEWTPEPQPPLSGIQRDVLKGVSDRSHLYSDLLEQDRKQQQGILNSLIRPEVQLPPQGLVEQQNVLEEDIQREEQDIRVAEGIGQAIDKAPPADPLIELDVADSLQNEDQQDIDKAKHDLAKAQHELDESRAIQAAHADAGVAEEIKEEGMRALTEAEKMEQVAEAAAAEAHQPLAFEDYGKTQWGDALKFGTDHILPLSLIRGRAETLGLSQSSLDKIIDNFKEKYDITHENYAFSIAAGSSAKRAKDLISMIRSSPQQKKPAE